MRHHRMAILIVILLLGALAGENASYAAEAYPTKAITCIVPMEAGADGDINMRFMMEKASAALGKPIVIVNKPGAGHTMGYREVYKARPDGYTIGTCTASLIMAKMQGLFNYDHRDFTLLGFTYHALPILLASMKTPRQFKSVEEIVSFAKAHPGDVSMATTSVGGAYWLSALLIEDALKVKFNLIPQEGSAGFVVTTVAGGHTDLGVTSFASAKAQIEAGNIRFLAVAGPVRYKGKFGDVKTLRELGYDASMSSFAAVIGPPKMPKDVVDKLVKAIEAGSKNPEFVQFNIARNMIPDYMSAREFLAFCNKEEATYRTILSKVGKLKTK